MFCPHIANGPEAILNFNLCCSKGVTQIGFGQAAPPPMVTYYWYICQSIASAN